MSNNYRVFQGKDTNQICGRTGNKAFQALYYFEPINYEGDTLWSKPFQFRKDAEREAEIETEEYFDLGK